MPRLNTMLGRHRVPPTGLQFAGGRWGSFDAKAWTMSIGLDPRSANPVNKKALQEFLVTLYHDERHAEQDFLEVRKLVHDNRKLTRDGLKAAHRVTSRRRRSTPR